MAPQYARVTNSQNYVFFFACSAFTLQATDDWISMKFGTFILVEGSLRFVFPDSTKHKGIQSYYYNESKLRMYYTRNRATILHNYTLVVRYFTTLHQGQITILLTSTHLVECIKTSASLCPLFVLCLCPKTARGELRVAELHANTGVNLPPDDSLSPSTL